MWDAWLSRLDKVLFKLKESNYSKPYWKMHVFHLLSWQVVSSVWAISIFFVNTGLLVWAIPQSHRLNLTCCFKSCQLLAFCFLLVCMVDQTQIFPSSISPLGLFQRICNFERQKGGTLEPFEKRGGGARRGRGASSYHGKFASRKDSQPNK